MTPPNVVRSGMPRRVGVLALAALLALSIGANHGRAAGTIVVDTLADTAADDGTCSLREAIVAANTDTPSGATTGECPGGSGADEITFGVGPTITLTADLPELETEMTVDGGGTITVSGDGAYTPFTIASVAVTLRGLTITGGLGSDPYAGPPEEYKGGGVDNGGTLRIVDSTITGNRARGDGRTGGFWNTGVLAIEHSTISDNPGGAGSGGDVSISDSTVTGNTGGVGGDKVTVTDSTISDNGSEYCGGVCGESVTVTRSTISGNGAYESAGGISGDDVMIIDSTVGGNSAVTRGGIVGRDVTILGSTISGNVALDGSRGGIYAWEQLLLVNSTVTGNTALANGGIGTPKITAINSTITKNVATRSTEVLGGNAGGIGSADIIVKNSIVAGNSGGTSPDIDGTITSRTASIVGVPNGLTLDDILDPAGLADHGGPTKTIALIRLAGNPALGKGDPTICAADPVGGVDQRGLPRPASACDVGAFEAEAPTNPFTDIAGTTFEADIDWLFRSGITNGCTATTYCPGSAVSRGQMAAFLDRALDLPDTATDYFTDDEASSFEANINRLAAAGITKGCTTTAFCPGSAVTRGQMAAFLDRALDLPDTATDYFTDDEASSFEANINRLAAAGITKGCTPTTYCPKATVTRGQMAAFLRRALEGPAP